MLNQLIVYWLSISHFIYFASPKIKKLKYFDEKELFDILEISFGK
jgi:hypothetical protein